MLVARPLHCGCACIDVVCEQDRRRVGWRGKGHRGAAAYLTNDPALTAKVLMNFAWAISIWSRPMEESFPITREASRLGNESGLFVEASYALFNEVLDPAVGSASYSANRS